MAAVYTAGGGGEPRDILLGAAPLAEARPHVRMLTGRRGLYSASSVLRFGRARHLRPVDLIEHEPVAAKTGMSRVGSGLA